MEDSLVQSIIKEKKTCYFISPHFDDAILSAGALMKYLSKYTKIVVINIFTKAGPPPYTLSARAFLTQVGYTDAQTLFIDREKEDAEVLSHVANKVINLGYTDALWRKKSDTWFGKILPELDHIYLTYRFHIIRGIISKHDRPMINQIVEKVHDLISDKNAVVFAPLGVGSHIDHVITHEIAKKQKQQVMYWSDFPYNEKQSTETKHLHSFSFGEDLSEKKPLIQGYTSQYQAMFKDSLHLKPETFYYY
jgi:LmbE family N-acetylglucosaminyl deacetylase